MDLTDGDKPYLAPIHSYIKNDMEVAFEAGPQRTYYKTLILFKKRAVESGEERGEPG